MLVNVKTKKMQEVEVNEEKEIDVERLLNVLTARFDSNKDMISISKESLEDVLLILKCVLDKEKALDEFEETIPEDMLKELKAMAGFLALSGIKL